MKKWKQIQRYYNATKSIEEMDDNLSNFDIVIVDRKDLVENILMHFSILPDKFYYPSKAYVVAIVYARLISENFNEEFYDVLNDEELLNNNDKYYVPYNKDKEVYDSVLSKIGLYFDMDKATQSAIKKYFNKEFMYE